MADQDHTVATVENATVQNSTAGLSSFLPQAAGCSVALSQHDFEEFPSIPSFTQNPLRAIAWSVRAFMGLVFLIALLAIAATIPLVNVFAMGFLMESQGRVARSGKFRSAFYLLPAAQRLGGMLVAVSLWLLPVQFLAQATRDSWLLAPWQPTTLLLTTVLILCSVLIAVHILLATGCGGSFWRFFRPIKNARQIWTKTRSGDYLQNANQSICQFVSAYRLPHLFRMGLLGYATVYVWLTIPTLLFTMLEDVTNRLQVAGFVVGCIMLTITLLWLPLLLAHVAAEARFSAMFEFTTVRKLIGQTPFRWAIATAILLACSSLPLLYSALFKIKIPPHAAKWDLMVIFLLTVIPARVMLGWVYHRATHRTRAASSWPWRIWQWTNGAALCVGIGYYVYFLNLAAAGGELGKSSIWQFHSLLLPLPF
ncbi:MAG: hypothetical protein O2856_03085 [Planctomycetota bacterium]|nr:hypothetical protein [Planctomycetota bacterium]